MLRRTPTAPIAKLEVKLRRRLWGKTTTDVFSDVADAGVHEASVRALADNGVLGGTGFVFLGILVHTRMLGAGR